MSNVNRPQTPRQPSTKRNRFSRVILLVSILFLRSGVLAEAQEPIETLPPPSGVRPISFDEAAASPASAAQAPESALESDAHTNWNVGFLVGAGFGIGSMGSKEAHDLTAATLHVGRFLRFEGPGLGSWLRHLEASAELWGGAQYNPEGAYLVGFTPVLRYHLLPHARLTPFVDGGAGITATDIKGPDLSTIFEFNLQAGVGLQWKCARNVALVLQARYIHLSNAHIDTPNFGVNTFLFSGGLTYLF